MQTQDYKNINSPGQGHGNHVCSKCGWSFPNPHPSAKNRRAHKKICGKIEGYKLSTTSSEEIQENKPNLDEHLSEDDSRSPSLEVVKKVEQMAITRSSSSSGVDVFTDAVTEFADVPPVAGSIVVRETAVVVQGSSEDVAVTQQDVGNAVEDAGDLYPPHYGNGTQLQNVECSGPENEMLETDMPSQHHLSSSTVDSISNSDSSVMEASISESILQCSKIDTVLDSEEKGNLEAVLDKKSENAANVFSENAGKTSEVPQMVNTDNLNILPANAAMEVSEKQVEGFFDARNISFAKGDFFGQINSIEEASDVEAGRSLEMLEGHGSINVPDALPVKEHSEDMLKDYEDNKTEKLTVAASSSDLAQEVECVEHGKDDVNTDTFSSSPLDKPSKHSEDIISGTLDPEDCSAAELSVEKKMEIHTTDADMYGSINAVVDPDKDDSEIGEGEMVNSPEKQNSEVFVDTDLQSALDGSDNLTHSINGVKPVHNDSEHNEKDAQIFDALEADITKVEEKNIPTIATDSAVEYDAKTREVEENLSEDTPIVAQSDDGRGYELGSKTAMSESSKASLEKFEDSAVEYDVKTRGVEENLSEDTPIVAQSDDGRDDEHGSKTAMSESSKASLEHFQDSEAEVKDLGSSSKQMVGGECVNLLGTNAYSGIDDSANMTKGIHFEENCAASDSVDASLFNNAMNNETQQDENEAFEDAKERENFDKRVSGEECLGKVDLGLISDNDDGIDLTQNTSNKIETEVQAEALSAVQDSYTRKNEGSASDFAGDAGNVVKQEEANPDLDAQVDSFSQTDSLEGNWGSVSVLSAFSDAPAGTETGSLPSQSSNKVEKDSLQPKPNNGKSDILNLPDVMKSPEQKVDGSGHNEGVPEAQTSEKANESSGSKKTEEIIAKVANWSTASGKQHMSLKNFLGDASSPNAKDNPPLKSPETEKIVTDNNTKEPKPEAAMGEMQKEWNSPARYPTNIKREKGKVRSKPYWVPFMCCSSVQTS